MSRTGWVALAAVTALLVSGLLALAGPVDRDAVRNPKPRAVLAGNVASTVGAVRRDPLVVPASPAARKVQAANGGRRPNVIVVMLDDMRADEMRFAPRTRKFISDRGLVFRNAYSPYPLCCPARSSFLKGQYPHNHGVLYISSPYAFGAIDDRVTIGSRMWDAGYRTTLVGKYLNRYGINRSRVTGKPSVHYVPRGWTDWLAALDPFWHDGDLHGGSVYDYFNFTQDVNGRVVFNRGEYSAHVIARQVRGLVARYHRHPQPFFMFVTPPAPHTGAPFEADDPGLQRTSTGRTYKLDTPARPDWVKGRFDAQIPKALGVRPDGHSEPAIGDKMALMRRWPEPTRRERTAMRTLERQRAESIYAWDAQFGRIVAQLRATGELRHTVFMFTSDNGYFDGEHRQRQGKIWAHDPALRIPFAVAGPGIERGVRYTPIMIPDLTATILDIGRARPLPRMDGRSLLPQMVGPDRGWDRAIVTEGLLKGIPHHIAFPRVLTTSGLLTGRYKLIRYANGAGELYDLFRDPNELTSLWADPAYRSLRYRLVALWKEYRTCTAAECRMPLPKDLQTSRSALVAQYASHQRRHRAYYGN